ncbi:methyltransferase [Candidatus Woesearchaeota archaeon]|nr:methyltransferase [Candidatus Woesearchaeota archaeon]
MQSPVYYPKEDSYLLQKHIQEYAEKAHNVLDVGTGTGILAIEAAKYAQKVVAVDINPQALAIAKANMYKENKGKLTHLVFKYADIFSEIKEKFDLIICNPPYLPADPNYPDIALDGGKKGYEFIEKFLNKVNDVLTKDGKVLLLFSSLTKKDKVEEFIKKNLLTFEKIDQEKFSFELLYVYELQKTALRKKLESLNIKDIAYFTKGRRGILFKGILNKKQIVVKATNETSKAFNRIANEATILRKLEQYNIAPKIVCAEENFLVYEFIEGTLILNFIEKAIKSEIITVIKTLFEMMYLLDTLNITKEEMHHPIKHIIITTGNDVKLLDFERAHRTDHPKNVTQFCQFLINTGTNNLLKEKEIVIDKKKIINASKMYRKRMDRNSFGAILDLLNVN